MDGLKEVVETLNSRIRNPIFGAVFLAFVALNFDALFLLFLGEGTANERISVFRTIGWQKLVLAPIIVGLLLAFVTPWLRYFGAWVAEVPSRKHKMLQDASMSKVLEQKNRLEEKRNQAVELERERLEQERSEILAEARVEDELAAIQDESVKEKAVQRLNKIEKLELDATSEDNLGAPELGDIAKDLLIKLAISTSDEVHFPPIDVNNKNSIIIHEDENNYSSWKLEDGRLGERQKQKILQELVDSKFVSRIPKFENTYVISDEGIDAALRLKRLAPLES